MPYKHFLLAALLISLTTSCSSKENGSNSKSDSVGGSSSPSENIRTWATVSYTWVSAWDPCQKNKLTINRQMQISTERCGKQLNAFVSDADFELLEVHLRPVLERYDSELECNDESIMDWAVYTSLSSASETKVVYSFDGDKNCSRGDRAAAEKLQDLLNVLHEKYVPDDSE